MSTVLRASGRNFDVDAFVAKSKFHFCSICHRGDPRFPRSKPKGRKYTCSGLTAVVSDAAFTEFEASVKDAIKFLKKHRAEIRRLVAFRGVTSVFLDFGVAQRDSLAYFHHLPAELIILAGACGIAIELSHYSISEDNPPPGFPKA